MTNRSNAEKAHRSCGTIAVDNVASTKMLTLKNKARRSSEYGTSVSRGT